MEIKTLYCGEYPNACSGRLKVIVDDKMIFDEFIVCHSTGGCYWDSEECEEVIADGKIKWPDIKEHGFSKEVRKAIKTELKEVNVCCGGCM
ncbi:MAG: hypothetical protein GY679_01900 [Mycoplasma sp.]|nr:hypothetical protein [Mycoplasma sp.]